MPEPFTTMRDWDRKFMRAVDLSATAKVVGWAMSRYATYETGRNVRPSTARIAYETGVSGSKIRGAGGYIERLVETGWLIVVRSATRSSAAVFRLGIGEYRPDWNHGSEPFEDVSDVENETLRVVPTGDEVVPTGDDVVPIGDELGGPPGAQGSPSGGHQGGPYRGHDHVLNHLEETKTLVRSTRSNVSDTEPGLPIDIPDTPKPRTKTASKKTSNSELEAEFATWWTNYPRKLSRAKALKAYIKARGSVSAATLTDGLARQLPAMLTKDEDFLPYGSTWLNEKRWEDPITASGQGSGPNVHIRPWQPVADAPTGGTYRPSRALEAVMGSPARHDPAETRTDAYSVRT